MDISRTRAALIASVGILITLAYLFFPHAKPHYDIGLFDRRDAIAVVHGSGVRKLFIFESTDCEFCRQLNSDLATLDNATIYIFALPGHSRQSRMSAQSAWCSADRADAWKAAMEGRAVQSKSCDSSALERNLALAKKIGLRGTPTTIFGSGVGVAGLLSLKEIKAIM